MKTVCIVYETLTTNYPAIEHNSRILEKVFGDYITVKNCSLAELQEEKTTLTGDAFLISNKSLLKPLRHFISDFKKIIIMERSILKQNISQLMEIPAGSDVLVVNDEVTSALSTVYELYELGFNQLNLIPFDPAREPSGIYRDIRYAVSPNELSHIPDYIHHIINIQYRVISFSTMLKLMDLLQLDANLLHFNLIQHLNAIAQPNLGFHNNFLYNYLKSEMLDLVIADSDRAILVVDGDYHLVYFNEMANRLFEIEKCSNVPLSQCIDPQTVELLRGSEDSSLLEFGGESYVLEKTPLKLLEQLMGYCLTLESEHNLRKVESRLTTQLRKKGYYAQYNFSDIIHVSPSMDSCISLAKQIAATDYTILIRGESGVGKELMAQSIHNYSSRKGAAFVAVNCTSLPESLLESQLFGYDEGAFTGAYKKGRAGLFEQAHMGTIFLDEIGDISPNLQAQLLRILQEKQVMRIGSDQIINVDVRIITATNCDLEERVRSGQFREDLFYRLNVIPLKISPLRQRREDILPLLQHFLGKKYDELSEERLQHCLRYSWPGNVRQLENFATYFKTLGLFPSYLTKPGISVAAASSSDEAFIGSAEDLSRLLLQLIARESTPFHGIGRTALQEKLRQRGVIVSDGKLRQLLVQLESNGQITVSRGRTGCRITEAGRRLLSPGAESTVRS